MEHHHTLTGDSFTKNSGTITPAKTKPSHETKTITSEQTEVREDSYVYVHCYVQPPVDDVLIRIWKTTFLIDKYSGSKSQLVHTENISLAPQWTLVPRNKPYSFLLIFTALAKSCTRFDLVEDIPQSGGFLVKDIQRNETDVYHVDIL